MCLFYSCAVAVADTESDCLLGDKSFPREKQHACLLIPDREHTTDQSMGTTEVQLMD